MSKWVKGGTTFFHEINYTKDQVSFLKLHMFDWKKGFAGWLKKKTLQDEHFQWQNLGRLIIYGSKQKAKIKVWSNSVFQPNTFDILKAAKIYQYWFFVYNSLSFFYSEFYSPDIWTHLKEPLSCTARIMKFLVTNFFSFLGICSLLLKKFLTENFNLCTVSLYLDLTLGFGWPHFS